ncbi:MAG: hypothetical protein WB975_09425 [Nitrososphaeraceae archaeon]
MNQKSANPVCIICGKEISAQLSANQIQDPKQSICKECEERKHDCKCEICGDTVNSTVYETHLRENHTKEQMATQIAMRMINSLQGH